MALNLNKLFVRVTGDVPVIDVSTQSKQTGNEKKIYFLEATNQIINNGIVYGVDPGTVSSIKDLQELIGAEKITDAAALSQTVIGRLQKLEAIKVASNSVDYLTVALDSSVPTIGIKKAAIETATESTKGLVDVYNAKQYIDREVAEAKTVVVAGEGIDVDASTADVDGHSIYTINSSLILEYNQGSVNNPATITLTGANGANFGTINVSDITGAGILENASYEPSTGILILSFNTATGENTDVRVDLKNILDLGDLMVDTNSTKYLQITQAAESQTDENQLTFAIKTGEVAFATDSSTALADAYDVKQYVDSQTTDLAITAEGDNYIDASVDPETDKKHVKVTANIGSFTATQGTAGTYDADGSQVTAPSHGNLVGEENKLADASVIAAEVKKYVDGELAIEAARSDAKNKADIAALDTNIDSTGGTNVSVNVVETDGIITAVTVAENYATIDASTIEVTVGDESKMVKASDIAHLKAYVDKQSQELAVDAEGDTYVTAEVDGADNKKINVSTNIGDLAVTTAAGQPSVMTGVEGKLADASDIAGTVTEFVNARINEELAELDATANVHDTSSYINVSISEVDGLLDSAASSIDVTYGSFTEATPTNGIATREGVQDFVDTYDFWTTYTPSNNG